MKRMIAFCVLTGVLGIPLFVVIDSFWRMNAHEWRVFLLLLAACVAIVAAGTWAGLTLILGVNR